MYLFSSRKSMWKFLYIFLFRWERNMIKKNQLFFSVSDNPIFLFFLLNWLTNRYVNNIVFFTMKHPQEFVWKFFDENMLTKWNFLFITHSFLWFGFYGYLKIKIFYTELYSNYFTHELMRIQWMGYNNNSWLYYYLGFSRKDNCFLRTWSEFSDQNDQ